MHKIIRLIQTLCYFYIFVLIPVDLMIRSNNMLKIRVHKLKSDFRFGFLVKNHPESVLHSLPTHEEKSSKVAERLAV